MLSFCDILMQVLRKEFPKGIDIIYESVGGDMLKLCLDALAVHGRLIVIGMISQVFTHFIFLLRLNCIHISTSENFAISIIPWILSSFKYNGK